MGILSITETKLNWSRYTSFHVKGEFHKTWQFSTLSSSQVNEQFASDYQPYGTLTAVMDWWTSRVHSKGQDPFGLGRWSFIT
ncbi:MAG: hypothetical protein ACK53Y_08590, partial [bacterium]